MASRVIKINQEETAFAINGLQAVKGLLIFIIFFILIIIPKHSVVNSKVSEQVIFSSPKQHVFCENE